MHEWLSLSSLTYLLHRRTKNVTLSKDREIDNMHNAVVAQLETKHEADIRASFSTLPHTHTHIHTHTQTHTHTDTHRHTDPPHTQTHTDAHGHTNTYTHRHPLCTFCSIPFHLFSPLYIVWWSRNISFSHFFLTRTNTSHTYHVKNSLSPSASVLPTEVT